MLIVGLTDTKPHDAPYQVTLVHTALLWAALNDIHVASNILLQMSSDSKPYYELVGAVY